MFCKNCGKNIDDNAVVCPECGVLVEEPAAKNGDNTIAIVGFVLSFFIAIAGLVCSVIGYKAAKKDNLPYGGLALAGIVISIIELATIVVYLIVIIAALAAVAA